MKRLRMPIEPTIMIITCLVVSSLLFAQEYSISAARLAELGFEAESPEYKALSDEQKIGVLAQMAAKAGGFDKSTLLLMSAIAERGNAEAQYTMGTIYRSPSWRKSESGIKQNPTAAHEWFLKAARQGHRFAAVQAADDFFFGNGATKDLDQALRWYEVAAKANDPYAQRMAGSLYIKRGQLLFDNQDINKGVEWLKKAADNGDEVAKSLLRGNK